jgi:hypothetical protein
MKTYNADVRVSSLSRLSHRSSTATAATSPDYTSNMCAYLPSKPWAYKLSNFRTLSNLLFILNYSILFSYYSVLVCRRFRWSVVDEPSYHAPLELATMTKFHQHCMRLTAIMPFSTSHESMDLQHLLSIR